METENNMNKNIEEEQLISEKPLESNPPLLEVNVKDDMAVQAVGPGQI